MHQISRAISWRSRRCALSSYNWLVWQHQVVADAMNAESCGCLLDHRSGEVHVQKQGTLALVGKDVTVEGNGLNLVDGVRSVSDIREWLLAEFTSEADMITLDNLEGYFGALEIIYTMYIHTKFRFQNTVIESQQ